MTGSANGWTSSSSSSSSSDPGSSDEDFAGSGGGGGILIRRLSGLSGSLSAVPSTRLSLGAPSYASSGGEGGGNLVVPPFPSSEIPIDGGGASPSRDRKGLRSFDRGLRSREVLPYSPMGEPQSSVASLTSRSTSSGSVSRSSGGHCSRDREGRRGGGGDWGWAGDRGATSGNRLGSGESPQEKGVTMTTACSATMGSVRGGGSGGGGSGGGDWGSAFAGDLEREAGGSATRLRRREGWIV